VEGASVYFVSISGKTRASVLAAESARRAAASTVAVTADTTSPLAAACNSAFALEFKSAGKTSGTIGFTASLLACARIAAKTACPEDLKSIYNDAARIASRLAGSIQTKEIVILGESALYPVAIYGTLKFSEVLGSKAVAHRLEDFCHAPLFGHLDDQAIMLGARNDVSISRRLKRAGVQVQYVDCGKYDRLRSVLYASFFMQHLALAIARRKKMKECYFLQNRKLLAASSDIIY
jgi:fructoselysine-6-P-deglycase FrlB-like protein